MRLSGSYAEETGLDRKARSARRALLTALVGSYHTLALFTATAVGGTLTPDPSEVTKAGYFGLDELPEPLLWGQLERLGDVASGVGGSVVRVLGGAPPADWPQTREELYDRRDASGLARPAFYSDHARAYERAFQAPRSLKPSQAIFPGWPAGENPEVSDTRTCPIGTCPQETIRLARSARPRRVAAETSAFGRVRVPDTVAWRGYFFSWWPPNCLRMAESARLPKSSSFREENRE